MTANILTAFENPSGTVVILVETSFSESLYAHLKLKKVDCQHPSSPRTAAIQDRSGKISEVTGNIIIANGTAKDFNGWFNDWELPFPNMF